MQNACGGRFYSVKMYWWAFGVRDDAKRHWRYSFPAEAHRKYWCWLWFNLLIEPCENILSFDPAWFCKTANRVAEAYGLVSDLLRKNTRILWKRNNWWRKFSKNQKRNIKTYRNRMTSCQLSVGFILH